MGNPFIVVQMKMPVKQIQMRVSAMIDFRFWNISVCVCVCLLASHDVDIEIRMFRFSVFF